jgi:hypothetical protein
MAVLKSPKNNKKKKKWSSRFQKKLLLLNYSKEYQNSKNKRPSTINIRSLKRTFEELSNA